MHIMSPMILALTLSSVAAQAQPIVSETFDTSLNGWSIYADAELLTWDATGGNPGGAARARDQGSGGWWGFLAPAAFRGDHSCMYNGSLQWSHKTNGVNTAGNSQSDVTIEGAGLVLCFDVPNPVLNQWASRSVVLSETAGWKKTSVSGVVPTQAEFLSVLANITALKFRGEFTSASGGDIGFIDNVAMGSFTLASPFAVTTCPSIPATFAATTTGPNSRSFQWQWQPVEAGAWINIVEGLNTDGQGGPVQFNAQGSATTAVTLSQYAGMGTTGFHFDTRCLVTDACGTAQTVPARLSVCPIDFNCDGAMDFFDYDDFVAAFEAGDPTADFDADGTTDFFDYDAFVVAFEAGC